MYISKVLVFVLQPTKAEVSIFRLYIRHVRVARILETCYKTLNVKATKYATWFFFTHHESLPLQNIILGINEGRSEYAFIRGRPFDSWGGRGVWVISEKKFLQTNFGGKILYKEIRWEKNSYTEKISFIAYNAAKKNLTQFSVRKKFYLQSQVTHTRLKTQRVGPYLSSLQVADIYIM